MIKFNYINAIRGIAILAVIMIHTSQYGDFNVPNFIAIIVSKGGRGVQLFYLASAFTLFYSYSKRFDKEKSPNFNFFLRRFFRIAPMYYLGIIYYLFQDGFGPRYWLGDESHISILNIFSNVTFLHGFNPYWITSIVPGGWSIAVEMSFYFILPLLFAKIKNLNTAIIYFACSLILNLLLFIFLIRYPLISDSRLWGDYLFLYFPNQVPVFFLGIMLYFIIIKKEGLSNISNLSILLIMALFIIQLILGIQSIFPNHVLFGIVFLFFIIVLSKYQFTPIVNPVINYIGKISFSMYLVHFAVLHWLTNFNFINYFSNGLLNYITRYGIVVVLSILISSILYKLVEIPFQKFGKIIIDQREKI